MFHWDNTVKRIVFVLGGLLLIGGLLIVLNPVLLHTHILAKADYQSCGAYNEEGTGVTLLNPFRFRAPERIADEFLRLASNGKCLPEVSEELCRFLAKRPLPATNWHLAYRRDVGNNVDLFYRLGTEKGCAVANVGLERTGSSWKISRYGVSW
jgi:hypothetical protein